ncbi:MAG TPA: hypothetical protein VN915_00920 [Elusimicrobiota bacterium]|nr:hypothetical protein [Elusimicrobiota bacterium]
MKMARNVTVEAPVQLDYPKGMEVVTSPHYTLRFSASPETQVVEVSIDGGPWRECRKAGGHFWFDWANYMSGRHEIIARAMLADGQTEETGVARVRVELEHGK